VKVEVRYSDGRLEQFDSDRYTRSEPFPGRNLMTDITIGLREDGLRADVDYYDAGDGMPGESATRRRGWSVLLVAEEEMPHVESVTVDGMTRWQRIGPSLADLEALQGILRVWCAEELGSIEREAAWAHGFIRESRPDLVGTMGGEAEICAMMGMEVGSYEYLASCGEFLD
jgi:hypothetical protein